MTELQKQPLKGILKILKINKCYSGKISGKDSLVVNVNILNGSSKDIFLEIFRIFSYGGFVDDLIMDAFSS